MVSPVGIDDLNVYASTLTINYADIATARNYSESMLHNVRFLRRSLLPPYEDPVTLAVNAAKPIIDAASPDDFELLIVATETGLDYAKPLSSYVHQQLGLGSTCSNFEIKHACYAGTAAMQMAAAWVRSGIAPGKRALVVTTDIGRKHFNELAEITSGAGAVAFSISDYPRIFELETMRGYASRETYDTARPTADSEWIDAPLSVASYLDLIEMVWERYLAAYSRSVGSMLNGELTFSSHFNYLIYHTPFISLIERAHYLLLESEDKEISIEEAAIHFEKMAGPSLCYTKELGNIYSGSIFLALAGLIENAPLLDSTARVGVFSYGSGACAELFSGFVGKEARNIVSAHRLYDRLAARRRLNLAEYESVALAVEQTLAAEEYEPNRNLLPGHYEQHYQDKNLLVLESVRNHYRSYGWS